MKTLYFECNMGASGDMLFGALIDLVDKESFIKKINNIGIPHVIIENKTTEKCGISGNHVEISIHGEHEGEHHHHHDDHHHHMGMHDIENIINSLKISEKAKTDVINVYKIIAEAESKAHNRPVTKIHFHEVGMMDAIADITAVCMLIEEISPEKIYASPIHIGYGQVKCAHGILPVPAPATAHILENVPIYGGEIKGELCTPTGAALLKYFVGKFGEMPRIKISKTGYGMGTKDFPAANMLRVFLGEEDKKNEEIAELSCNLDDMTPEAIAYATKILLKNSLDVFTTPIYMKKNRPAIMLTCLCKKEDSEKTAELMLKHTSTLGVREKICKRYTIERKTEEVETKYGKIRIKISNSEIKPEYDDVEKAAEKNNVTFKEVYEEALSMNR